MIEFSIIALPPPLCFFPPAGFFLFLVMVVVMDDDAKPFAKQSPLIAFVGIGWTLFSTGA